jgi:hypothetical protein
MFVDIPSSVYAVTAVIRAIGNSGIVILYGIASLPMEMLTFPKSRFGSFCSAQALIRAAVYTLFGLIVGVVFDYLKTFFPGEATFHYRAVPMWALAFSIPAAIMAFITYREWGRLGGYKNYKAPASWNKEGYEEIKQAETKDPSSFWLKAAMYCFDFLLLCTIAGAILVCVRNAQLNQMTTVRQICSWVFPCQIILIGFWLFVRFGIFRDIARCLRGEKPKHGIPHHGMLLFLALRQFIITGVVVCMAWFASGKSTFLFLLTDTITNILLVLVIYVLSWMERGIVIQVETK